MQRLLRVNYWTRKFLDLGTSPLVARQGEGPECDLSAPCIWHRITCPGTRNLSVQTSLAGSYDLTGVLPGLPAYIDLPYSIRCLCEFQKWWVGMDFLFFDGRGGFQAEFHQLKIDGSWDGVSWIHLHLYLGRVCIAADGWNTLCRQTPWPKSARESSVPPQRQGCTRLPVLQRKLAQKEQ